MTKGFVYFRRIIIAIIAVTTVLQWAIVIERARAAVWAWYKFVDHGGGGHIVVGRSTQVAFLMGSGVIAAIGYVISGVELREAGLTLWGKLARFGWSSITICLLFWIALLISPLVAFARTS